MAEDKDKNEDTGEDKPEPVKRLRQGYEDIEQEKGPLIYEWPADYPYKEPTPEPTDSGTPFTEEELEQLKAGAKQGKGLEEILGGKDEPPEQPFGEEQEQAYGDEGEEGESDETKPG